MKLDDRQGGPIVSTEILRSMDPAQTPEKATEKAYLDIKELKARTGLSVATLHRLKRQGKLPHFQPAGPGGRLLFPPDAIERCAAVVASSQPPPFAPAPEPRRHLSGRCPAWMQPTNTSQETSDNAPQPQTPPNRL